MTVSLLVLGLPVTCENLLCPRSLLCVISGLAGGSPGFRTVLCCFFSHLLYGGHRYVPCPFALFLAIPILWMMQSHYLNNCADGPFSPCRSFFCVFAVVVFWFVVWFGVVSVCRFGFALILFGIVMASLDCVLVLLQHGLLWPIFSPRWMNSNATINANMLHANIACGST
jgi:hypothetical protein